MFIVIPIEKIEYNAIQCGEKVQNIVMNNSSFVKLYYSTNNVVINGIFIQTIFNEINVKSLENYSKIFFNQNEEYNKILERLDDLENNILKKYEVQFNPIQKTLLTRDGTNKTIRKIPILKLRQQFQRSYLKLNHNIENITKLRLLIKISGIWITDTEYGITFKFIPVEELTMT